MADQYEIASDLEQRDRDRAAKVRKEARPANGACFNCFKPSDGCYCSTSCKEDFEKREKMRAYNG